MDRFRQSALSLGSDLHHEELRPYFELEGYPFTSIDSDGIDGVCRDDVQIKELLDIISTLNPP
jgi:hypothetical protein